MNPLLTTAIVILISFDGLRPDAITPKTAPHFYALEQKGISAKYMEPSFPSSTFVNHASLMTGCTPEEHGIVSNRFLDPVKGEFDKEDDSEWQECEPLWAATTEAKIKTAVYVWPIAQTPWHGIKPDYLIPLPKSKEEKAKFFRHFDTDFKPAHLEKIRNTDVAPLIAKILHVHLQGRRGEK